MSIKYFVSSTFIWSEHRINSIENIFKAWRKWAIHWNSYIYEPGKLVIMLVKGASVLKAAKKGKYAVGAFNINDLEMLKAVTVACVEEKAPVIIQTTEKAIKYAGIDYLVGMTRVAATEDIPMALHFDHGKDLNLMKQCIKKGYTSVMFDGSKLPFKKNIAQTKKVVAMAKGKASVEAELGVIFGKEDSVSASKGLYTDPKMAKEFVKKTKIDSLAVAIGTKHGLSKKEIALGKKKGHLKLRFDILKEIHEDVNVPLVLHGGSDVPHSDIKKCIKLGICKVNIDTDLRVAFTDFVKKFSKEHPDVYDPREFLGPTVHAMKNVVKIKVREFGATQKA